MEDQILKIQRRLLRNRVELFFKKFKCFFTDLSTLAKLPNDIQLNRKMRSGVVQKIADRFADRVNRAIGLSWESEIATPLSGIEMLTAYHIAGYPDIVLNGTDTAIDLYRAAVDFVVSIDRSVEKISYDNTVRFFQASIRFSNCLMIGGSYEAVEEDIVDLRHILSLKDTLEKIDRGDIQMSEEQRKLAHKTVAERIDRLYQDIEINSEQVDRYVELVKRPDLNSLESIHKEVSELRKTEDSLDKMFLTVREFVTPERSRLMKKSWNELKSNDDKLLYLEQQLLHIRKQRLYTDLFKTSKKRRDKQIRSVLRENQ